jgi:hypothetical protein
MIRDMLSRASHVQYVGLDEKEKVGEGNEDQETRRSRKTSRMTITQALYLRGYSMTLRPLRVKGVSSSRKSILMVI